MSYYKNDSMVFSNGNWVKAGEAKASLYDQTLHYGNGVFEGIRSYNTAEGARVFKAREHYKRLLYSCKKMHIKLSYSVEELTEITYQLLAKNNLKDAYIRPLVYLGPNMALGPVEEVHLFMAAWEWGRYLGSDLLNVTVSPYQRPNPKSCHVEAKVTGHYINSILATTEAKARGFDEALLPDANGYIAEGAGANFFYEKDGKLFTPPLGNILPGITRATVFELAEELGMELQEKFFKPEELKDADGAFFTGTAAEIAGVGSVDRHPFKLKWEETLGFQLSKKYKERVLQCSDELVR